MIVKANKKGIELAVKYLRTGKTVVYPTDTAYGLGVDATNPAAIRKLIKIKNRPNQPIHVIVQNLSIAKKLARVDSVARKLIKKFLPGPLTLVLPITLPSPLPSREGNRKGTRGGKPKPISPPGWGRLGGGDALRLLSAGTGTIGIRMPDNRIALTLAKKLGKPITTPSANPHGGETPYSVADSLKQFKNKNYQPDLYLDAGKLKKTKSSTMVLIKNGTIKILRKGPVSKKQILKTLQNIP